MTYEDNTPKPLSFDDIREAYRASDGPTSIVATESLYQKIESLIHPNFRTDPLRVLGLPVFLSTEIPVGQVRLMSGGEIEALISHKTSI